VAILLALCSGLVYGVSDYVGGRASRGRSPIVVTLLAELTLLSVTATTIPFIESNGPTHAALWWGVCGGIAGSTGVLGLYYALSRGNMTVVAPITGIVAAAVPVIVGLALGERPGLLAGAGIVLALAAVLLIGGIVGVGHGRVSRSIVLLAAAVGVAFGMLFVAYSRVGEDSGLWPLLTARFGATPLLLAGLMLSRRRDPSIRLTGDAALPGVAIGLLIGLANGLYLLAAQEGLLSVVAVLVALYPASTVALAAALDDERASRSQLMGMGIAVAAVAIITVGA
jgi:drug/metabolite transporter (DMT)-like permease